MKSAEESNATDEALVQAVLRRDRNAFRRLIERYEKLVIQIVFRMVKNAKDREDLCQDVFLKVYNKLDSFRFGSKLSTWIGSIAFNTCINHLRRKKIVWVDESSSDREERGQSGQPEAEKGWRPDEVLLQKEKQQLLWKLVDELPPLQQTALSLFHKGEFSLQEISAVMSLPEGTIKSHIYRARQTLRKKLLTF